MLVSTPEVRFYSRTDTVFSFERFVSLRSGGGASGGHEAVTRAVPDDSTKPRSGHMDAGDD